jgi:hypothetical protein
MRTRMWTACFIAIVFGLFAAGCGSSDDESGSTGGTQATATQDSEAEAEAERDKKESEGERSECKKPATSKPTGLPSGFPKPDGMTITEARKDGPSVVVDGYIAGDIPASYAAFQAAVTKAGYKVLFNEREEHDAEISYSGGERTGQIALRDICEEAETTSVHITNRPA